MVHPFARKPPSFQATRALSGFGGAGDRGEPDQTFLQGIEVTREIKFG
jgi:hypothetical protein